MSILRSVLGVRARPARSGTIPWETWQDYFTFGGQAYPLGGFSQTLAGAKQELADGSFGSHVRLGYGANGVVFACMLARLALFSEARFRFRREGKPGGDLYATSALRPLEKPWRGGTTGDLLARMITDSDLSGNSYTIRRRGSDTVRRVRPDWVGILLGSPSDPTMDGWDVDAEVYGYVYFQGGQYAPGMTPEFFYPDEVAHFAPIPDPLANFRGMSWLTPIVREVAADSAARDHKLSFFENGATPNMVVKLDQNSKASASTQAFKEWVDKFRETEPRGREAYRTMYLAGGTDVTVVGANLQQLDFKVTQGAGETRVAAAAGVPPVIVGLSEGLQAATYSNYGQARRRFADLTMRPLWRNASGSLATIVPPPRGDDLWYEEDGIAFLQEDQKDAAEIAGREALTIRTLVDAGYLPDSVTAAVAGNDWAKLKHSGLYSVQLQPPQPNGAPADAGRALAALIAPHLTKESS